MYTLRLFTHPGKYNSGMSAWFGKSGHYFAEPLLKEILLNHQTCWTVQKLLNGRGRGKNFLDMLEVKGKQKARKLWCLIRFQHNLAGIFAITFSIPEN